MKLTKKQLRLYLKINFLILAFFVVISLMNYLNKKGLPEDALQPLQIKNRPAVILTPPNNPPKIPPSNKEIKN